MKSLVRWSTTLGLVGSTLLGTVFGGNLSALALPQAEVVKALDSVAVFVITNKDGLPLSRPLPKQQNAQNAQNAGGAVTGVYMSRGEAQAFIEQLRKTPNQDPKMAELVKNLQVTAVPLGVIYEQVQETAKQPNRLVFAFKPVQTEVDGAMTLLRQTGQQVTEFKSVPVFLVRFGPDKGYVSIKAGSDQEIVPAFLAKQDAQGLLTQVKQKFPAADIQVVDIDGIIQTLEQKNDAWLKQVVLVPSPEVRQYISSLPKNGGAAPQAAPARNPQQRPQR